MLKRITFTGIDDTTDIERVLDISRRHPFVEWGVLIPMQGRGRWPSRAKVEELVGAAALAPFPVQLAAHICEPHVAGILAGAVSIRTLIGDAFQRVQINTHGDVYHRVSGWQNELVADAKREYILQLDGVMSPILIDDLREDGEQGLVAGLYDLSHGAGVLPSTWPAQAPPLKWVGYAGGLGPDNLAEQFPLIDAAAGGADYWIDMETRVRSNGDLDFDKVQRCIDIVSIPVAEPA